MVHFFISLAIILDGLVMLLEPFLLYSFFAVGLQRNMVGGSLLAQHETS